MTTNSVRPGPDRRVRRRDFLGGIAVVSAALVAGCGNGGGLGNQNGASLLGGSAPPGRIAFIQHNDVLQWSGGSVQRIATGKAYADPAWSPDGKLLAVVVSGTNQSDVVLIAPDGSTVRQLTSDFSSVSIQSSIWARRPAWSPDGKQLAYVSDRGGGDMSLWEVGANGGTPSPLVPEAQYSGGLDWPAWSPNGGSIAFVSFAHDPSLIESFNLKTRQVAPLASDPGGTLDPAWSPDGKYLAYVARSGTDDNIVIASLGDGTSVHVTQGGINRAPTWSPKSDGVAFLSQQNDQFGLYFSQLTVGKGVTVAAPVALANGLTISAECGISWVG